MKLKNSSYSITAISFLLLFILLSTIPVYSEAELNLPEELSIAILQMYILPGDNEENIERNINEMTFLVEEAVDKGAEVIVMPEYWAFGVFTGGKERLLEIAETIPGGRLSSFLVEQAKKHNVYIVGGSICEKGDGENEIYNTSLFIDPDGKILDKHRKVSLYSPLGEHFLYNAGNEFNVVETSFGNVAVSICYDGDFPENYRLLKLQGANIVFQVSAYETPCENWWKKLYEAHAMTNAFWVIQSNGVGKFGDGDVHLFGMSRIVSPNGKVLMEATYYPPEENLIKMRSEILFATINLKQGIEEGKDEFESLTFDRSPELYKLLTEPMNK